ncbi:MAG: PQQ-binding-like beta-propeller repeat protein [Opitutaceae bacterium]|nr:PQQ-binding-like beta-propeller repeat protein [Opitutaceae bacterium]
MFNSLNPGRLRRVHAFSLLLLALAAVLPAQEGRPISPDESTRGFRARTLLARPRADLSAVERAEVAENLRLIRAFERVGGLRTLETDGVEDVQAVIARLIATGLYDYVEPDYIRTVKAVPNDPRFAAEQWALQNNGQSGGTAGADIKAVAAWDVQREAPDVVVAIMDTGLRLDHEDIVANLWRNPVEAGGVRAFDDDLNGYVDDVHGINAAVARSTLQSGDPTDSDGHGTHVAGIIGAVGDNNRGVAGVAWRVQLMPLRFIEQRGGSVSAAVACIDYAIARKAHIINASYSSTAYSQAEFDAIKRARDAGILFVAAAGNDSQEISAFPEYPAAYALDNIVAVASTTRQDRLANYSTYGSGLVELAAPGSSILSVGHSGPSAYATLSGTSMSAPHVAGALALLKQRFPDDDYRALINRVLGTVDVLPALEHRVLTNGRLNVQRALTSSVIQPFNDTFARRATLVGDANIGRGSNRHATREAGEPDHGVASSQGSLWWSWTAPAETGRVTITTTGSEIDTVVAVYEVPAGTGAGGFAALRRVAFNDNADDAATWSSVSFNATGGTEYALAIAGKDTATGLVAFNLTSVPLNDAFANARPLAGSSVVVTTTNANAGVEANEPRPRNARGTVLGRDRSLWFKWTAPATRNFQISALGETTDPLLAVYTGTALASLVEVGFDDDGGPVFDSLFRLTATAGVTYYIKLDTAAGAGGRVTLTIADAAWQYVAEDPGYASPALAADGTVYFPDSFGFVHAVTPAGTRKWRSSAIDGYILAGALTVAPDGTIYGADDFGYVYAIDPANGAKKWEYSAGDFIWAAPALAADGTLYIKSDDGFLYALNPDGTRKWRRSIPGDTYAAPAIAPDGTIYIGSGGDSALYALNPDGTEKWRAALEGTVYATPALGLDGTIYLGNYDGRFFAFRPDGTERWRFDTGSPLSGSAAVDAQGTVYFGSYNRKLYALDGATGARKWEYATGDIIRSTAPVLADDGTIYIGSDDGRIHALDTAGRLIRTYATAATVYSSPLLAAGRLYVASADGKLYAFDTGNNLARAPWPMTGQNPRRLARATEFPGVPAFARQPAAPENVQAGGAVRIEAAATVADGAAISYQWYFNDAPIAGATSAVFTLASVQGSDAGVFRVVATGSAGSTTSRATTLRVAATATDRARLVNLAVRTSAGSGDNVLFVGFAVGGAGTSGTKPLLVRGVGPTLGAFGVTGVLDDPRLQVFEGSALLLANDDWSGEAQVAALTPQVGAFALAAATSKDAALVTHRAAGSYTVQIAGAGTAPGTVLAELYDGTPAGSFTASTPRLVNVSARTHVGRDGDILIAGFVIGGSSAKQVMIRAVGPTLGIFGVTGVLADPKLELFQAGNATAISTNDNWGAAANAPQVATAAASVGAFPLALESKDAVLLVSLPPGGYTAQVSGVNNTIGAAVVEIYEVP